MIPFDLPPKPAIWVPPKPAIVRAASLKDIGPSLAMPLMTTFASAGVRGLRPLASVPIATPTGIGSGIANSNAGSSTFNTGAGITAGGLLLFASTVQDAATANILTGVTVGVDTLAKVTNVQISSAGDQSTELWFKENCSAQSSGVAVTATYAGAISFGVAIAAAQVPTGIKTASSLDASAVGPGTAITNPTASTGALAQAKELIIGVFGSGGSAITGDAAFTNIYNISNGNGFARLNFAYKIVASNSSVTYAPTQASANVEAMLVASFKGN